MPELQSGERCILSLRVARALIERGFQVVDVETSHKIRGKVVIKFNDTAKLNETLEEIRRKYRGERIEMFTDQ